MGSAYSSGRHGLAASNGHWLSSRDRSTEELATYLKRAAGDEAVYNKHIAWKSRPESEWSEVSWSATATRPTAPAAACALRHWLATRAGLASAPTADPVQRALPHRHARGGATAQVEGWLRGGSPLTVRCAAVR